MFIEGTRNDLVTNSRSIFSITTDELKTILQTDNVVHSPVKAIPGGQYVGEVDVGQTVGNTGLKFGGKETSWIREFTDRAGNLITVFPIPAPYRWRKVFMNDSLLNSFHEIYLDKNNLLSYKNYYNALRSWIKKNEKKLSSKLQYDSRLKMLIELNEDKYLVDDPEFSLEMEEKRMRRVNFSKIDTMLMIICDTLWDMVTIRSEKNCPCCGDGDLRYIKVESNNGRSNNVLLECNVCGGLAYIDGCRCEERKIDSYHPACKEEILVEH